MKRTGSSPPSPVFDLPPRRFIAIASVSCASREIEPSDIAPVTKRLTISLAGSTSSMRQPLVLGQLAELQQPAQRRPARRVLVDELGVLVVGRLAAVADRVLEQRDRLRVPHVVLALAAPRVDAADGQQVVVGERRIAARVAVERLERQHVAPMPPIRDAVPMK